MSDTKGDAAPAVIAETSEKSSGDRPGANGGGRLRTGNRGNRGGGRKPDKWRDEMAAIANMPRAKASFRRLIAGKKGPQAAFAAYKYATEQAYGKATNRVEVAGSDKPVTIIIRKE